jgi:sedoheptulokinase
LLQDFFVQVLRELGGVDPQDLYEKMAALGEKSYPQQNPLTVDTRFQGTRADPHLRGVIDNIGMDNFTPGHLVAAFLEGMVAELKSFYDCLPEDLKASEGITGSGNAIRRNALLRRIIEDTFGKPLQIPDYQEEAAMGAAMVAQSL